MVRKVGLQANDWVWGLWSRRKYHFLAGPLPRASCQATGYSSALRDTASPWKAEVVLPLQRVSLRRASLFPSPPWGLTFTGRTEAPRRPKSQDDVIALVGGRMDADHLTSAEKWAQEVVTAPHQMLYQQIEEGGLEQHVGKDLSISMAWDQEWVQMFTEWWECGHTLHYLTCLRCELSKGEKTDLKDPLNYRNSSDFCPVFYKPMGAEPRTLRNTLSSGFCKGILIHIILLDIIYISQHHKKWTVTTTQTNNLFP